MMIRPLRLAKRHLHLVTLVFLFLTAGSTGWGQLQHRVKAWKAIVLTDHKKVKGILYDVSDSSIVVMLPDKHYREVLFSHAHKVKLRTRAATDMMQLIGATVGAVTGGILLYSLSAHNPGWGTGNAGGIYAEYGGAMGGLAGVALGVPILGGLFTKKFTVGHDSGSYAALAAQLRPYSIRGQSPKAHGPGESRFKLYR